jgi:hypothetical protein
MTGDDGNWIRRTGQQWKFLFALSTAAFSAAVLVVSQFIASAILDFLWFLGVILTGAIATFGLRCPRCRCYPMWETCNRDLRELFNPAHIERCPVCGYDARRH